MRKLFSSPSYTGYVDQNMCVTYHHSIVLYPLIFGSLFDMTQLYILIHQFDFEVSILDSIVSQNCSSFRSNYQFSPINHMSE